MSKWQPIETAPRDRTRVLVWLPDFNEVKVAWYSTSTSLWPSDEEYNEDGEGCNVGLPTHWMHLPEPPKGITNE